MTEREKEWPETCRRDLPGQNGERCNLPAKYIVWGKLFAPEHLGPRCEDCLLDQQPSLRLYQLDQYAIYKLPDLAASREQVEGLREALERIAGMDDPVACGQHAQKVALRALDTKEER
jgi:hypothetical protein